MGHSTTKTAQNGRITPTVVARRHDTIQNANTSNMTEATHKRLTRDSERAAKQQPWPNN